MLSGDKYLVIAYDEVMSTHGSIKEARKAAVILIGMKYEPIIIAQIIETAKEEITFTSPEQIAYRSIKNATGP